MSAPAPDAPSWTEAAAAVAAAVDALAHIPTAGLDGAQLAVALEQAAVQASRLHAVATSVIAEADARKAWRTQGASSLRGWVRRCVQLADDATRLVAVARMRAHMPRMAALFSAGQISLAQMGTAARQVRRLPDGPEWANGGDARALEPDLSENHRDAEGEAHLCAGTDGTPDPGAEKFLPTMWGDLWSAADGILAERAHAADARTLAALGEQIYAAADPGGHLGEELSHRERRCLSISRGFEGMGEVAGRLDPEAAERAITVLNALAQQSGPDDDRSAAQRRADAFDTLCKSWLESGKLPAPNDGRPRRDRVIVTIPYRTLTGLRGAPAAVLGSAGSAGLGTAVSAQAARRMACDASIRRVIVASPDDRRTCSCDHICSSAYRDGSAGSNDPPSPAASPEPAPSPRIASGTTRYDPTARLADALRAAIASLPPPLGARSAVIDAGRCVPTFTQPMRDALHAQYGGRCTFSGCDQSATVDHHLIHWADGGPTSVANGAPLCEYHHYLVHEGGWRLQKDALGRITTVPPPLGWCKPSKRWRNGQLISGPPPDPHPPRDGRLPHDGRPPGPRPRDRRPRHDGRPPGPPPHDGRRPGLPPTASG